MIDTTPLEAQILATVLSEGRRALQAVPDLGRGDFAKADHRAIISACLALDNDDSPVDHSTVYLALPEKGEARHTCAGIYEGGPVGALPGLVRELKTVGALTRAGQLSARIAALSGGNGGSPRESLEEIGRVAQEIVRLGALRNQDRDVLISLSEIVDAEVAEMEKIIFGEKTEEPPISTGITRLDDLVSLQPGQLVVIGGASGSGKSSLCAQIALAQAQRKESVVFVTSEMSHREMLTRMASSIIRLPVKTLVNRKAAIEAEAHLEYRNVGMLPIDFQRSFPPKIEDANAAIRTAVSKRGAKLAIIDYAQRLATFEDDQMERAIAKIAHDAKNLALELGIVVIAAAQINRQGTTRGDPRPLLSDLRGSGTLEQNADIVMFVYQPSHYGRQGSPQVIVAKQRNGPTGEVNVVFDAERCAFRSI